MASQRTHCLRPSIYGLLSKVELWPSRTTRGSIQKPPLKPKLPKPSPELDHTSMGGSISTPDTDLQAGAMLEQTQDSPHPIGGMHESVENLQSLDTSIHTSTSALPYPTSPEPDSPAPNGSLHEIPIAVLPPDHPPNDSGDLVLSLPPERDEHIWGETGTSWSAPGPLYRINLNDNTSQNLFENDDYDPTSHSFHSSPESHTPSISNSRDVSLRRFSAEYQWTNRSHTSIVVPPLAHADTDSSSERRSVRGDSSFEVADHIYPLIPSNLKRYTRERIM